MEESLFSLRMRASQNGRHVSGAERIVDAAEISKVTAELMNRAVNSPLASADEVHCSLELIDPNTVRYESLPDLSTYTVDDWTAGRRLALSLLVKSGVCEDVASRAMTLLADGAGLDGQVMRGAIIMDANSGERLEADQNRGVRASRMDLVAGLREGVKAVLAEHRLDHHRVREALVLAGKVLAAPGVIAELCWSDSADYVTGYVSDPCKGYQRISILKPHGDLSGGRVFFVDLADTTLPTLVDYLEHQPVLFNALGQINPPRDWTDNNE